MSSKNKGPGRPPVDSERVDTRLPRDLLDAIDTYAKRDGLKTRPDAVRAIIRDWCECNGYLPIPPEDVFN